MDFLFCKLMCVGSRMRNCYNNMIVSVSFSRYKLLVLCINGFSQVATGRGYVCIQRPISIKTCASTQSQLGLLNRNQFHKY